MTGGEVLALEAEIAARHPALTGGLAKVGVEMARRALRLPVRDFAWREEAGGLILEFFLPAGAYATTVLRELVEPDGESDDAVED